MQSTQVQFSHAQDHDFSGLDEGSSDLSLFQPQFADGVRCNHRGDLLAPDRECDLGHDAIDLYINDAADQRIARADSSKLGATSRKWRAPFGKVKMLVQFAFRNAMMSALSFDRLDFSCMDPPLESGITDAEHFGGVPKLHQFDMVTQESVPPLRSLLCRVHHKRSAPSARIST